MDNPKQCYEKYKYRVKVWEKNFKKIHGRIPSKHDIREASKEIRYSYKMYYKLKTSFLEDTLNDVLSEDGFDIFDGSQSDANFMTDSIDLPEGVAALVGEDSSTNTLIFSNLKELNKEQKLSTVNKINVNDEHVIKEFEPVEQLESNKKAWVENKSQNQIEKDTPQQKDPFKSNLSAKLFSSTSFSKRNPRKSLSRAASNSLTKSSNSLDIFSLESTKSQDTLPDLETILTQKSQQKAQDELNVIAPKLPKEVTTDIDQKWLERCQNDNIIKGESSTNNVSFKDQQPKKFGISNINLANSHLSIETSSKLPDVNYMCTQTNDNTLNRFDDSDSVVSNSEEETSPLVLRHVAKKRRILKDVDINRRPQINKPAAATSKEEEKKIDTKEIETKLIPKEEEGEMDTTVKQSKRKTKNVIKKKTANVRSKQSNKKSVLEKGRKSIRTKKNISYCESNSSGKESVAVEEYEQMNEASELDKPHKSSAKTAQKRTTSEVSSTLSNKTTKGKSTIKNRKSKKEGDIPDISGDNVAALDENSEAEYHIDLDMDNLTSLPRINVEEIAQAETALNKYINTTKSGISTNTVTDYKQTVAKKKLEAKVASGKLNENFVRLNMKKKVFVKGKKTFNYGKYKKTLWKRKKEAALSGADMDMRGCDGGVLTCFKCGQPGHFAQQCKVKGDNLLPLNAELEDESPFPTLEEAERLASQQALQVHSKNIDNMPTVSNPLLYRDDEVSDSETEKVLSEEKCENIVEPENQSPRDLYIGHKIPEDFLKKAGLLDSPAKNTEIEPLYKLNPDGSCLDATKEVIEVLRMFGHKNFRKGQDKAVMRILSGLSTLVTLSTGSGKSLCYQLPAYLYSRKRKAITLVISPLVSLMEDQVHGVPVFIRAHCLHTNQTPQQRLNVLELLKKGEVDVLLVSPEAVVAGEKSTGFGAYLRNLPPIAFACIDEAHCVSQWSHNFRPSYLMICKVLRQKLRVRTILGLTATATLTTRESIIRHLDIPDGLAGIISDIPLPDNLVLSASADANRDAALIQLLRSERFDSCQSIIIYCTRRDECERIAGFIRTCLQDKKPDQTSQRKRKRVNWNAEPYHAGMPAYRRRTIQKAFMENQLRIVVATVAFGMGINKSDIRAIIHYNMPKNFESYVQEVGRAGRDGKIAHCHLFLDSKGLDQSELRRHIYANSIDRHVIRKLLQKVFIRCACEKNFNNENFVKEHSKEIKASQEINWDVDFSEDSSKQTKRQRLCPGHEIGFSIESEVQALDIPAENISTLLCYLELDGRWGVNVLSNAYVMAKIISYAGSQHLKKIAKSCPPLAMAIALELKKGTFDDQQNILELSVIEIASAIGWNSGVVKHQLKNLEWTTVDGLPKRSSISVNFYELGFRLRSPGDFTDEELDEALDALYIRTVQQENTQLIQLQYVYEGLSSVAYKTCAPCCDKKISKERSDKLKEIIREYFKSDYNKNVELKQVDDSMPDEQIVSDVRTMIHMYPENNFTGRALARIFHGIPSPNYPAVIWSRCKYWRSHTKSDFNRLVRLANLAIVKMRT